MSYRALGIRPAVGVVGHQRPRSIQSSVQPFVSARQELKGKQVRVCAGPDTPVSAGFDKTTQPWAFGTYLQN